MSDPTVKNITLVSKEKASEEGGGTRRKGRKGGRSKTLKVQASREGGGSANPGTETQVVASRVPGSGTGFAIDPVGVDSALTERGAALQITGKTGGASQKPMKVVLAEAKKKGKVILAAAKPPSTSASKTRKSTGHAKKVRVTISNLGKKIHMAKEIRKAASGSSMEEVKKILLKAGLIKTGSKAPDAMLRQIYADFMTLKGRAL